ncbi:MAG: aldo/keto reductase [Acidimicrobiaceae bacterium]|nr:aldo/keto reductase [Acidimicrobiaceae bacterium]
MPETVIDASGTFDFADFEVHRLGFGAMRLTGPGVWGPPADHDGAVAVLRRAVELGVDFIDTADSYGPYVSEELIREALHPYPDNVIIATKAGQLRTGPGAWFPDANPNYLRQECEMSLRRLGVERLDLFQLHRLDDPMVPLEEQFGLLADLLSEGKVASIGLSNASVEQITLARSIVEVSTVQNRYNLTDRSSEDVLDYCHSEGIGFIPWFPIAAGKLAVPGGPLERIAREVGATAAQVSLAWLLALSPVVLPIPGTSSLAHLEENCAAAGVTLTRGQVDELTSAV